MDAGWTKMATIVFVANITSIPTILEKNHFRLHSEKLLELQILFSHFRLLQIRGHLEFGCVANDMSMSEEENGAAAAVAEEEEDL